MLSLFELTTQPKHTEKPTTIANENNDNDESNNEHKI